MRRKMMNNEGLSTKNVIKAAEILSLRGRESLTAVKNKYRQLVKEWHPDQCEKTAENCEAKIEEITWAYEIIKEYCDNYLYSFAEDEIIDNLPRKIRNREKLRKQFGSDPLWGK